MDQVLLKRLIDTAAGRIPAQLVIRNARVVDLYNGEIVSGDIAVTDGYIAGVGQYAGQTVVDAGGRYAAPGLIDSHIHIAVSYTHLGCKNASVRTINRAGALFCT